MVPQGGGVCGKNLADSQDRGTAQVGGWFPPPCPTPHPHPPEAHTQANLHTLVPSMAPHGPQYISAFGAKNCFSVHMLHMVPRPALPHSVAKQLHWCIMFMKFSLSSLNIFQSRFCDLHFYWYCYQDLGLFNVHMYCEFNIWLALSNVQHILSIV